MKSTTLSLFSFVFSSSSTFIPLVLAASRTTPPSGCLHVGGSGGNFTTVQSAIDSLSTTSTTDQCVFLDQGTYNEQVYVAPRSAQLTLYGYTTDTASYSSNAATITYGMGADEAGSNDASGTLRVHSDDFRMYNVDVENSHGQGDQAIALSAYTPSGYYGCSFLGFQDTLLANVGNQFYHSCLIRGATDFIFGQEATAWFEGCDVEVVEGGQYITASGRDEEGNPSWYVFNGCNVDGDVEDESYYLGRPWRTYARVVFQDSELGAVIKAEGWSTWNGDEDVDNVVFGEVGNTGEGSDLDGRVEWMTRLEAEVGREEVWGGDYEGEGWFDGEYPA